MSLNDERRVVKEDTNDGFIEEYSAIPIWKVKKSIKKLIKRGVMCGCEKCNDWVDVIKQEFGKELIK